MPTHVDLGGVLCRNRTIEGWLKNNNYYITISGVNVDFCSMKKSGSVALSESLNKAKDKLSKDQNCSSIYSPRLPKKMMPWLL